MRIAVIGSGIAGLSAAYLLSKHGHEVTVFERSKRLGMDSHGVDVDVGAAVDTSGDPSMRSTAGPTVLRIDMPLRVFQESYYPHLTHLYGEVGVRYRPEDYAASFTSIKGDYHFGYRNLIMGTLSLPYVRRFKLRDPAFWRILRDCIRFFVLKRYSRDKLEQHTFIEFLTDQQFSTEFIRHMIIPTMAVLCTCSYEAIEQYPAHIVIDYLSQRSMRGVRRLVSGAQDVVARLSAQCREVKLDTAIDRLCLCGSSITVHESSGRSSSFDHVILAVQANHALGMLERGSCAACAPAAAKPSGRLSELVGALRSFRYEKIEVALHSDPALMPTDRAAWSPVNLIQNEQATESMASIWMNAVHSRLGATRGAKDVFQTVNPLVAPRPELTYAHSVFERPVVTHKSLAAIRTLHDLQGKDRLWIVGSYAAVGVPLLETGVTSAVAVCRALGASCSWDQSESLQTASSAPSHSSRNLALAPRGLRPLFMLVAVLALALSMAAGVFARSAGPAV